MYKNINFFLGGKKYETIERIKRFYKIIKDNVIVDDIVYFYNNKIF